MSVVADAEARARREIERSPDVFFVRPTQNALYAVLLPQDAKRFVLIDDEGGYDVMFLYRRRWHPVSMCWRQLKGRTLDPCESVRCSVVDFGRKWLRKYKVREMTWKEWREAKPKGADE